MDAFPVLLYEVFKTWLIDWGSALIDGINFTWIDIDEGDIMAHIGKTCAGHASNVATADD